MSLVLLSRHPGLFIGDPVLLFAVSNVSQKQGAYTTCITQLESLGIRPGICIVIVSQRSFLQAEV